MPIFWKNLWQFRFFALLLQRLNREFYMIFNNQTLKK